MKRICIFYFFVHICMIVFSQANYDAFVGTWSYQENDTVFKIRLQKGTITNSSETYDAVFGGYSLSVRGILKEHYIQAMPMSWNYKTPAPQCNIYIKAFSVSADYLGFTFYDQRKQHADGKGIPCGRMDLIAPNKLHWKLNEYEGLWWLYEGTEEGLPALRGFSVPDDVIMTKE